MRSIRGARALTRRRNPAQPWWLWLVVGFGTMLACAAVHAQSAPGVMPSLPPAPAPNRGLAPLPNGSTAGAGIGAGLAPPTAGAGVLAPPLVDPGMTVHRPVPDGPMPVIRPQAVQPNGTVIVPK